MWSNGNGFVQTVFSQISFEKNPKIWANPDPSLDSDRILFLSDLSETCFRKYLRKEHLKKNAKLSGAFREKGNCLYKNGDFNASLSVYNQALCLAPKSEDVYPITLANRSAVWYALQKYENSIADITRSLASSYPQELRFKLLERKAKCQMALKWKKCSEETIEEFVDCVKESDINSALKDKKISAIKAEFEKIVNENGENGEENSSSNGNSNCNNTINITHTDSNKDNSKSDTISVKGLESQDSPSSFKLGFADSVSIGHSPTQGRFTYANRDINPGEIIAVDEPYVKQLDKEHIKTHCWHCLGRAPLPIPCDNCSGVMFCSDVCLRLSSTSYHKYECGITDIIQNGGVGTWILAYRAISSRPFSFWQNLDMKNSEEGGEDSEDPFYRYNVLETHENSRRFVVPALMKEALTVVFFIRCLNRRGYFPESKNYDDPDCDPTLYPVELMLANKLRKFIKIASFNSHEVTEVIVRRKGNEDNVGARRVGTAINPYLALINHSCDPNHGRVWNSNKGTITAFATRLIREGEEIVDGYSATFSNRGKKDRHFVHDRYNFTCTCRACREDWPLLPQLEKEIKVKTKPGKVKKLKLLYKNIETNPSIENCSAFMKLATDVIQPPHALLVVVEDKLQRCLLKKYGA
ncbi:SET and MYND domain-containing protein 4-like [Lepeophtheirus salmonis]|uniref:SET and MYND domain-containing protein 4-like n=1 Tax=Lepeophtheirus salmonis TaxID=72036 RepID=UPI003AF34E22